MGARPTGSFHERFYRANGKSTPVRELPPPGTHQLNLGHTLGQGRFNGQGAVQDMGIQAGEEISRPNPTVRRRGELAGRGGQ